MAQLKRDKAVLIAIISVIGAAVPGFFSILYLVIDRTLPPNAVATGEVFLDEEVYELPEVDIETGRSRRIIMQDGVPIEIVIDEESSSGFKKRSDWLEQREQLQQAEPIQIEQQRYDVK